MLLQLRYGSDYVERLVAEMVELEYDRVMFTAVDARTVTARTQIACRMRAI
jgi:hypothetical protein